VYLQTHSITRSEYSSNLARSRPPSVSPTSLNHGLQVHLQTRSITAAKCISKLTQSRPPSASPNSLDHSLHVYLQTRWILACKFARSSSPSASPNTLDYGLEVCTIMASKCTSPISLVHGLQVYLQYTRLWPPSASPKLLDHGLGVYLCVHSIIIFRRTLNCSEAPPAASPDILCVDG